MKTAENMYCTIADKDRAFSAKLAVGKTYKQSKPVTCFFPYVPDIQCWNFPRNTLKKQRMNSKFVSQIYTQTAISFEESTYSTQGVR